MKSFAPDAEVLGQTLLSSILGLPSFAQKNMLSILEEQGITNLDATKWYSIRTILAVYERVTIDFGPHTMFDLGKAVPANAQFPPGVNDIDSALASMDIGYQMNHKNGYVGFYKVIRHDKVEKEIIIQCYNPYPCDFDRGIITAMARKFQSGIRVVVDETKPTKKKGGNESWYIVSYR